MKKNGDVVCINNELEQPVELWRRTEVNGEEVRTKIGLVTNITAYYHVLVQIKKKRLDGYYFKRPGIKGTVTVDIKGKTSDNPDWLFGKFDEYLGELVGF